MKPWQRVKALTRMVFGRQTWRMWVQPRSRFDYLKEVGDGTGSSTVMAPLLWITRTFPEAPLALWRLLDDGQEEREAQHDLLRLMQRPNDFYSGVTLWAATLLDWHVDGNAYWLKVRNGAGAVSELWWAPAWLLEPKGSEEKFITHYEYTPDANKIRLDPEDVVHFRFGLDPDEQRKGRSPLKSVLREVFTDDEAATFTASLLRNMGVPGLIVSPEKGEPSPGDDDVKATKSFLSSSFTGDKRGEPLVMSGPTRVTQLGFSPEQLSLRSLRRIPEERISAVIGVPAIVAGLGAGLDRSTFANMSEAREMAYENNIVPSQRVLAEEVRFQLLNDFEQDPWAWRVGFDLSRVRVLQEDRNKLAERLDTGVRGGWIRVAEARRELGLDAEDGDEIYLRPIAVLEVGQDGSKLPPAPLPEEGNGNGDKGHKNRNLRAEQRLMVAFSRDERVLSAVFETELDDDFQALGRLAEQAYRTIVVEREDLEPKGRKAEEEDAAVVARIVAAMALGRWVDGKLRQRFEVHWRRTADRTVQTINGALELGTSIPDHEMRAIVHAGGMRKGLVDVPAQTREAIFRALAQGRAEGLGPIDIARRIRSDVPAGRFSRAGSAYRAKLIARTETKYAQNVSSVKAYRNADNVGRVVAYDARLGETDEECTLRDGTEFSFEEAEVELGTEHPNGTLSFAPIVGPRAGEEVLSVF